MHAREMHARGVHAHEICAYEMHAPKVQAYETHAREMHACETSAHEMHTREMHTGEIYAHRSVAFLGGIPCTADTSCSLNSFKWSLPGKTPIRGLSTPAHEAVLQAPQSNGGDEVGPGMSTTGS